MAAYRRVYDSSHLQADCQENRDQLRNPTLGNRVWAIFTFLSQTNMLCYEATSVRKDSPLRDRQRSSGPFRHTD